MTRAKHQKDSAGFRRWLGRVAKELDILTVVKSHEHVGYWCFEFAFDANMSPENTAREYLGREKRRMLENIAAVLKAGHGRK